MSRKLTSVTKASFQFNQPPFEIPIGAKTSFDSACSGGAKPDNESYDGSFKTVGVDAFRVLAVVPTVGKGERLGNEAKTVVSA